MTLCGELASKPIGALALVALGYRSLSLTPSALGPVKAMLLELDAKKAEALLRPLIDSPRAATARSARSSKNSPPPKACSFDARCRKRSSTPWSPATPRSRPNCRASCRPETFVKLSREFAELDPVVAEGQGLSRRSPRRSPTWRR